MPTHIFTDEEKENLGEQMLEAGFPLLKQYGMTHTSVAKITQAAGIAVGTFYSVLEEQGSVHGGSDRVSQKEADASADRRGC